MQFTPRRRAAIAIVISCPIAYFYVDFASYSMTNIVRYYRNGFVACDSAWPSRINNCFNYSVAGAWFLVLAATAAFVGIALLIALWVMHPIRQIADNVGRFGPTSLGLRLRATGPRDETRRLADEIDAMLNRLAEGYEAQRRFASSASHELRTPLATQRALIEVSLSSALTPDQLDLLSRQLLATNERNEKLIDGLLTLAETERGLMARTPQRLDAIVEEVAAGFNRTAADAGVVLAVSAAPASVIGEAPLIERLVSNLVSNAIKYNVPDGRVDVVVEIDSSLTVSNTGPAVPPELVAGLFEPFRRMTGERLNHGGGVGLGLTIARSIVAAHGGSIQATANPGGGLTVTVRLTPA
ncbi:MAG: Signal transduction histidine kinase [Pseudonocardiales bacterium]|nr:Signal transduction histidine kinase [Jatrophihabitantaceae bacterium]MCW2605044.1 Signal transduction histidine kinase [Pseudonocardiales bacterium]